MKNLVIIFLAFIAFNCPVISQDSIVGYEYFFDIDPGFGNGNFTSIPEVQDIQLVVGIDISSLSEGHHHLFIRTIDSSGVWSHTQEQDFISIQTPASNDIIGLEYFYDIDPGIGNGTYIPHGNTQNLEVVQNTSAPSSNGNHTLFYRSLDENGLWSQTMSHLMLKGTIAPAANIVELEYFVDTDPGFGSGTNVSLANAQDISLVQNIGLALADGHHDLYLRTRDDSGVWSQTFNQSFLNQPSSAVPNMSGLEYFVDIDPGIGNGTLVGIPNSTDVMNFNLGTSASGISDGIHTLFVRSYDENSNYSLTNKTDFLKQGTTVSDITDIEYFVGDDPGLGNGNAVSLTSGLDIQDIYRTFSPGSWSSLGNHVSLRSKAQNGSWSLTNSMDLVQFGLDTSRVLYAEYFINNDPGHGNGTSVPLTKNFDIVDLLTTINPSISGVNQIGIRSLDSLGKWSMTNFSRLYFEALHDLKVDSIEYFIDNDPGYGNGTPIPITKSDQIVDEVSSIDVNGLNQGMHEIHVRSRDSLISWTHDNVSTFYLDLSPKNTPLRSGEYFFDVDPGLGLATSFTFPQTLDIDNLTVLIMGSGLPIGTHDLYIRTSDTLDIWSHTNIKEDIEVNIPLPVSWLSFIAEKRGEDVALVWELADKINVSHYNVQKLKNGEFVTIGKVLDKFESYWYELLDHHPVQGVNTYRIQQVDYDGSTTFSPERVIFFDKEIAVTIGPNPTNSVVNLMGITTPFNISVYNQNGQLLINERNSTKTQINLDNHPEGSYYLVLKIHNVDYKFFIIKI